MSYCVHHSHGDAGGGGGDQGGGREEDRDRQHGGRLEGNVKCGGVVAWRCG